VTFEVNSNFVQLPTISAGDIVHLRHCGGFTYDIKCIVNSTSTDQIEARVEAIFDSCSQRRLIYGSPVKLVGTTLEVPIRLVQKVILRRGVVNEQG
jgi:hypothetical protein